MKHQHANEQYTSSVQQYKLYQQYATVISISYIILWKMAAKQTHFISPKVKAAVQQTLSSSGSVLCWRALHWGWWKPYCSSLQGVIHCTSTTLRYGSMCFEHQLDAERDWFSVRCQLAHLSKSRLIGLESLLSEWQSKMKVQGTLSTQRHANKNQDAVT